ncbi:MAG: 50S ribosomal protein L21 [Elusimicrobia bacterium]|nr:50S ribosomal protein L21 [Elusimicrobiota bacterium]
MYAIIETGGRQYWVIPGETVQVDKLQAKEGEEVVIKALWSASGDAGKSEQISAGKQPAAKVVAEVLRHLRSPKVVVFKRRPKKAYQKTIGHRQELTELRIKEIQLS